MVINSRELLTVSGISRTSQMFSRFKIGSNCRKNGGFLTQNKKKKYIVKTGRRYDNYYNGVEISGKKDMVQSAISH